MSKLQGALGFRTVGAGFGLIALLVLGLSGQGCGSSSSGGGGGPTTDSGVGSDTSTGTDSKTDTPGTDTPKTDTKTDAPVATPDIPSTLLTPGNYFMLDDNSGVGTGTITSDGYVAVVDTSTSPVKLVAIPLAGGAAADIVPAGDFAYAIGKYLVVYSNSNSTTGIGTMGVWSHDGGYHQLSTASGLGEFSMSVDGSLIIFGDKESTKQMDIVVSDPAGTAKHTVVTAAPITATCAPSFLGLATTVAADTCDPAPSGGDAGIDGGDAGAAIQTLTLTSYDASGTPKVLGSLLTNAVSTTKAGDKIWTLSKTGDAIIINADGTSPMTIDSNVLFGRITEDGTKVIYSKGDTAGATSGPLYAASVSATPSPVKISDDKIAVFYTYQDLGSKYVAYGTTYDTKTRFSDLKFAPLAGGTPITVSTDPETTVFGSSVTADQSFAIWVNNVATGAGDMNLLDLSSAGAKSTKLASGEWIAWSPKGKTIVYNDNWVIGGFDPAGNEGVADIRIIDADGSNKHLVANQAENNFYLTPDKTKIIFSSGDPSAGKNGIYTATIP